MIDPNITLKGVEIVNQNYVYNFSCTTPYGIDQLCLYKLYATSISNHYIYIGACLIIFTVLFIKTWNYVIHNHKNIPLLKKYSKAKIIAFMLKINTWLLFCFCGFVFMILYNSFYK